MNFSVFPKLHFHLLTYSKLNTSLFQDSKLFTRFSVSMATSVAEILSFSIKLMYVWYVDIDLFQMTTTISKRVFKQFSQNNRAFFLDKENRDEAHQTCLKF
jgi:hypothetical protein